VFCMIGTPQNNIIGVYVGFGPLHLYYLSLDGEDFFPVGFHFFPSGTFLPSYTGTQRGTLSPVLTSTYERAFHTTYVAS